MDEPQGDIQTILSGTRLFLVMFSLTLAVFLMLLDSSIVATVSRQSVDFHLARYLFCLIGHSKDHQ